jgi:hypothetical protein
MQSVLPVGQQQIFGLVSTNRYFILTGSDIANRSIFNMLPGGGTPTSLGLYVGGSTYSKPQSWGSIPLSKTKSTYGKIQNVLLSQTMALYFNIGLNDQNMMNGNFELAQFQLSPVIVSAESPDCGLTLVVPMQDIARTVSINVINYLNSHYGEGATVGNLLDLANRMLGGDSELVQFTNGGKAIYQILTPSEVSSAIDAINNIFDGCRVVVPQELQGKGVQPVSTPTSARDFTDSEDQTIISESDVVVSAYPNPHSGRVTIEFTVPETSWTTLHIYTLDGRKIATLFEGEVPANETRSAEFESSASVIYVYRLAAGSVVKMGKLLPK